MFIYVQIYDVQKYEVEGRIEIGYSFRRWQFTSWNTFSFQIPPKCDEGLLYKIEMLSTKTWKNLKILSLAIFERSVECL